jgi:hypothetical protein
MMIKKIIAGMLLGAVTLFALPNDEVELMMIAKAVEKKAIVLATMELEGKKKEAFGDLYEFYQVRLMELQVKEVELISDYAKHYDEMTDDRANEIIEKAIDLEKKALKLKVHFVEKFKKILTSAEVIRYFQIEKRFKLLKEAKVAEAIPLAIPNPEPVK